MNTDHIKIDPEFHKLLDDPTPEEFADLERNLITDGRCLDPIAIWNGKNILLDGHNRLKICKKHNIPFQVVHIDLADRDAAMQWIIDHQKGRRNISEVGMQKLREWRIERVKKARKDGQSIREIAKNEGVSKSQVVDDIKVAGVQGCTPEKVKGLDDKEYKPTRSERVGQSTPKTFQVNGREPGDDSEEEAAEKKKNTQAKRDNGRAFDGREFGNVYGPLVRLIDDYKKRYGHAKEYDTIKSALSTVIHAFKAWSGMEAK